MAYPWFSEVTGLESEIDTMNNWYVTFLSSILSESEFERTAEEIHRYSYIKTLKERQLERRVSIFILYRRSALA